MHGRDRGVVGIERRRSPTVTKQGRKRHHHTKEIQKQVGDNRWNLVGRKKKSREKKLQSVFVGFFLLLKVFPPPHFVISRNTRDWLI